MELAKRIEATAAAAAKECFDKDYDAPTCQKKEEGLGIAISRWAEWDGLSIMRVFRSALEDANFHDEAGLVFEMLKKASA